MAGVIDGQPVNANTFNTVYIQLSEKGAALGVAPLNASSKIDQIYLPDSLLNYLGTWDASSNTPVLADGVGTTGDFYICSVGGTQDLGSGNITLAAGS